MPRIAAAAIVLGFLAAASSAGTPDVDPPASVQPADPNLIPEARAVLDYLRSVYGKKVISAINGAGNVESVTAACGKEPAIVSFDLSGWNSPTWGSSYKKVVQNSVDAAKAWHKSGGIVAMQCHWIHPGNPDGSAWLGVHGRKTASKPFDFAASAKPGTKEHEQLMRDLKGHADYLQQLCEANIPVLWRPLHEIDGGWFWWTDKDKPENTAALWRTMFDYFTRERKLHNLVWVYSAALRCGKGEEGIENLEMRKRFYPSDQYVDIVGIDVYPSAYIKIGPPQEDSYVRSFRVMRKLAPTKMVALCECEAIPDPDRIVKDGAMWLYCLPWWGQGKKHTAEWIKKTYAHDVVITRDELPDPKTAR